MSLQEYGEKWLDVDGCTRYFEGGTGARSCSFTVALQAPHLAAPTPRIWTATSSILLATSA